MAEEQRETGTSFESFSDAASKAFDEVDLPGPGVVTARVERMWLEKGGAVERTQYRVEIVTSVDGDGPGYGGEPDAS
jgi:hypothetical protein